MKITKLKSGYRINLSDADYGMMLWLITEGDDAMQSDDDSAMETWSPTEKAAYTRRTKAGGFMRVDESRR